MRRALLCAAMLFAVSQDLFASAKTDSIVTFLGGAQAKFVWHRWAWCNDDYTPKTQAAATAGGMSLMLMDTRTGTERTLLSGLSLGIFYERISRSGKWVTVVDGAAKKTYVVDLTASSPAKNVLLDFAAGCTYWQAGAWWIDPANGTEYVYAMVPSASGGDAIYKVKISANGTADLSTASKLTINSTAKIDGSYSVSADGRKLGGAFPWPNTYILDIPTGNLDSRHHSGESFGCQANLAPDNSYRFFHCQGDHQGIYMFAANMVNTDWFVNLSINLAGVTNPTGTTAMDFEAPRWTNHVQYYTATYPMGDNNESYCTGPSDQTLGCYMDDNGSLWSKTATWVQTQTNMLKVPKFFMGKFSADFKSQEKSILIASDPRYFQYGGDAWICSGTTDGSPCPATSTSPAIRHERLPGLSVARSGAFVNVHGDAAATVRITDTRGRTVRMWSATGDRGLDTRALAAGTYLVSVTTAERNASIRLPVTVGIDR